MHVCLCVYAHAHEHTHGGVSAIVQVWRSEDLPYGLSIELRLPGLVTSITCQAISQASVDFIFNQRNVFSLTCEMTPRKGLSQALL